MKAYHGFLLLIALAGGCKNGPRADPDARVTIKHGVFGVAGYGPSNIASTCEGRGEAFPNLEVQVTTSDRKTVVARMRTDATGFFEATLGAEAAGIYEICTMRGGSPEFCTTFPLFGDGRTKLHFCSAMANLWTLHASGTPDAGH